MKTFLAKRSWLTEEASRLDASAYANGGLAVREHLISGAYDWKRLDEVTDQLFVGSRFARTYVPDVNHGTPYITASDMLLMDLKGLLYLSNKLTPQMSQLVVREGWTLISCSGTIGRTSYVRAEMHGLAASHDVIRAIPKPDKVASGYLFAFLSSRPAQAMIQQRTYGSVIQHIEPHHIADLPVPLPSAQFQDRIHSLVSGAAAARSEARQLLDLGSNYFDALAGPMPSSHEHVCAIGVVQRAKLNARLDAFHHVGWANEGRRLPGTPIRELGSVTRPGIVRRIYVERGVPFVSGIDVYQVRMGFRQRLMRDEAKKYDCFIKRGQILVQRSGQRYGMFGRPAYVGQRSDGWSAGEHLIRITTESVSDTARIFAFLQSGVGRRTLVSGSYGTSIPELNPEIVRAVEVPELPNSVVTGVETALKLREKADEDEEKAIREVEAWLS